MQGWVLTFNKPRSTFALLSKLAVFEILEKVGKRLAGGKSCTCPKEEGLWISWRNFKRTSYRAVLGTPKSSTWWIGEWFALL